MFIHYMYVDIIIPLTKVIPIKFEPVTIYYQTLQTLIGHNGTRHHKCYRAFSLSLTWTGHNTTPYHNLNALPHALPYIFSQFSMVWGYLQRVTTRYRQVY